MGREEGLGERLSSTLEGEARHGWSKVDMVEEEERRRPTYLASYTTHGKQDVICNVTAQTLVHCLSFRHTAQAYVGSITIRAVLVVTFR